MSKNPTEIVVFANEGEGGYPPRQEKFRLFCQYSRFIKVLERCVDPFQCCFLAFLHKFVAVLFPQNLLSKSFAEISFKFLKQRLSTSPITTYLFTPIFALLKVVDICTIRAISISFSSPKFLKIKRLQHFSSFLSKKMRYISAIFRKFCDEMTAALHVLLNQHNQKRNYGRYFKLQGPNSGIVMLLVVLVIPVAFLGIKYSQTLLDRRQKILEVSTEITPIYRKYDPATVALIAAKNWNPAETVAMQDLNPIYEAAFDSGIWCHKSTLGGAVPGLISDNSGEEIAAAVPPFAPTTSAGKIEYARKDIKFFVDNDRIRAKIVGKSGFALPAECNLDLVLAIPTNSDAAVTEIGKASANFLKDNFYHTRGLYASVIPYSGKLSLPSDRYDGWTEAFPAFSKSGPFNGANWVSLYDLYGTSGSITTTYNSSGANNGYSIMCRANLFDATNASSAKYKRMNIRPCTSFSISPTDDTITSPTYTTYTPNPHFMMELTADLSTTYTKCNGLTPPSDTRNTSSFSFAALEWANNMFQNWTTDPKISAVAGGNNGILSSPSKTTAGGKKAIVLVVNKPDTFTAGEMTYLGLSDDADEKWGDLDWKAITLPVSARWSSICYGGGKFVAVSGGDALSQIAAYSNDGINWTESTLPESGYWGRLSYGAGKFVTCGGLHYQNNGAYSSDGINWNKFAPLFLSDGPMACYGSDKFIVVSYDHQKITYSTDGANWNQVTIPFYSRWNSICYGNDRFVLVAFYSNDTAYSTDGINWTKSNLPFFTNWNLISYLNGKFVAYSNDKAACSSDGENWTESTLPLNTSWSSICQGNGKFVVVKSYSDKAAYSTDGINWIASTLPSSAYWQAVCYGNGKFVTFGWLSNKAAYANENPVVKNRSVGNKTLKNSLGDGDASGVTTLTTNACNKLKQTYGSDVRIYLVKYKSSGDCTYLDNCATSSGGKSYDVANATALKATLDTIATDLKTWAEYREAKIVN